MESGSVTSFGWASGSNFYHRIPIHYLIRFYTSAFSKLSTRTLPCSNGTPSDCACALNQRARTWLMAGIHHRTSRYRLAWEWERLSAELSKLNLVTNLDRGALATYCAAYGFWTEALERIQKYGTMVKSPTGYPIQSPYLAIANRQAEPMIRIASEFGFTPASGSRISAPPPDQLPLLDLIADEFDDELGAI